MNILSRAISSNRIYVALFLLIVLVAVFFRFYNTPARYGFDFDPTRDVLVSIYGAQNLKFPLIGPQSGIAPFTFGPWYYYQIIFSRIVLPFDYAPWIYIGITSVISVIATYFIGKKLEGEKLGLLLALFMALSPAELGPITGLSNPNLVPITASLSLLLFVLFIKNKLSMPLVLIWGVIIGIGINNHYQMIGMLALPIVLFVYKKFPWKSIFVFGIGILLTFIPLLYFNLTNDWHTIRGIIYFQEVGKYAVYTPNRWLLYLRDFWPNFWAYVIGVPIALGYITFIYSGIVVFHTALKKRFKPIYLLLFVAFFLNVIFLRYFSGPRENYYFIYLHPFIILFFGWALFQSFRNKLLFIPGAIILTAVLLFVLKEDVGRLHSEGKYLDYKKQTENIITYFPNKSFQIYYCGKDDRIRSQSIAFLLYNKHLLDSKGIKVGIKGRDCWITDGEKVMADSTEIYFPIGDSESDLKISGWMLITPEIIYKETVEWYKKSD